VVVPVALVRGVAVPVVHVVDVAAVGNGHVPAALAVGVGVPAALGVPGGFALVVVVLVRPMQMAPVGVVDVVAVREGDVPASGGVAVLGGGVMRGVRGCGSHGFASWE
jgi:hypothetical protein